MVLLHYGGSSAVGNAVKTAIEAADRRVIGTDITLKSCDISLFQGRVQINGLVVHNPPGFREQPLLSVKKAVFDLGMLALLFNRTILIEELAFDGLSVVMDYNDAGISNCASIQDHLATAITSLTPSPDSNSAVPLPPPPTVPKEKREIELRRVQLTDLTATRGWAKCALGDIRYDDFSKEVGTSAVDDIALILMSSVMKSVTSSALSMFGA